MKHFDKKIFLSTALVIPSIAMLQLSAAGHDERERMHVPVVKSDMDEDEFVERLFDDVLRNIKGTMTIPPYAAQTLEAVATLGYKARQEFTMAYSLFCKPDMNGWDRAFLINYIARVGSANYAALISNGKAFVDAGINVDGEMFGALAKVDLQKYPNFVHNCGALFTGDMDSSSRSYVIEAVAKVGPEKYPAFVQDCGALFTGDMDSWSRSYVIEAVAKVGPEKYSAFVHNCNAFFKEGMDGRGRSYVIKAVAKVDTEKYPDFVQNCKALFMEDMDGYYRAQVIEAVAKVGPEKYSAFVQDCKALFKEDMCGYYRAQVIEAVAKVGPAFVQDCKTLFTEDMGSDDRSKVIENLTKDLANCQGVIQACKDLCTPDMNIYQRLVVIKAVSSRSSNCTEFTGVCRSLCTPYMDGYQRTMVISIVARVDPANYPEFVSVCNALFTPDMHANDRAQVIEVVSTLPQNLWQFMVQFIQENPDFFRSVPAHEFTGAVNPNITEAELRMVLIRLQQQYRHGAQFGAPGVAFEVHDFANRQVTGNSGETGRFNDLVLQRVEQIIRGQSIPTLTYEQALEIMRAELEKLQKLHPGQVHLNNETFDRAVSCVDDSTADGPALATTVSFLKKNETNLGLWLDSFLKESKNAYDGRNSESCVKGVRERVITSLRNTPVDDSELQGLFHQGESSQMLKVKMTNLNNMPFWAKQLKESGITKESSVEQAKGIYAIKIEEYFADTRTASNGKEIDETITSMLDVFDHMWTSQLKPALGD